MTAANPLVAAPSDTTSPFAGAYLIEDGLALAAAVRNGDWIGGALAGVGALIDTGAAIIDPVGTLVANGLGWVLDHVQPVAGWLDELTGDSDQVAAFAASWSAIARQLDTSADELVRIVERDLDGASGRAIDAYRAFQRDAAEHLHGAADWADAMATGMSAAAAVVQLVHELVRDALAQVVGSIVSAAAEVLVTAGLATPLILSQVTARVASLAGRLGRTVIELIEAVQRLTRMLDDLGALFDRARRRFDDVLGWAGPAGARAIATPTVPRRLRELDFTPGAPGPGIRAADDDAIVWRNESEGVWLTARQKRLADEYLATVREREPAITAAIRAVADACGAGELISLGSRLKEAESFYRKFATHIRSYEAGDHGAIENFLKATNDSVRFTFRLDEARYSSGVREYAEQLERAGFSLTDRVKNAWGHDGYQGINSTWVHEGTGQLLEVQFHTPASHWAKEATHPLYDEIRAPGTAPERLAELRARQTELFSLVPTPVGATGITLEPGRRDR